MEMELELIKIQIRLRKLETLLEEIRPQHQRMLNVFDKEFSHLVAGEFEAIIDPEFKPVALPEIGLANAP